jgi:hypothetical protein
LNYFCLKISEKNCPRQSIAQYLGENSPNLAPLLLDKTSEPRPEQKQGGGGQAANGIKSEECHLDIFW